MSLMNGLKSIRKERASLERDRVVIGTMVTEAPIGEAMLDFDENFFEGVTEEEIDALIEKLPESNSEDDEVNRILASKENLGVDEVLDIENSDVLPSVK